MTGSTRLVDLCVIGAGGAGSAAAMAAAALGLSVVIVERDEDDDGLRNADLVTEVMHVESSRLSGTPTPLDFLALRSRMSAVLHAAAPDRRRIRLAAMNIRVISGVGRFFDAQSLAVGSEIVRARRFFIATGATDTRPALPGSQGLLLHGVADLPVFDRRPNHLVIFGGNAKALTLAQGFRRFGSAVSLIADSGVLPDIDPELLDPLRRRIIAEGVRLHDPSEFASADAAETDFMLRRYGRDDPIVATHGLLAGARLPALVDLDLAKAEIETAADRLILSPSLRTSNPRVYAIGDVTGSESMQAAQAQVSVAMRSAFFRLPARFRPERIPFATATDPQIATVGLSEAAAREHGPVRLWRWPLAETDAGRALGLGHGVGHIKIVADKRGRILGAGIVGGQAREQIAFWTLAIERNLIFRDLANVAVPLPSLSELSRRAVVNHVAGSFSNRWVQRALALMRRLD